MGCAAISSTSSPPPLSCSTTAPTIVASPSWASWPYGPVPSPACWLGHKAGSEGASSCTSAASRCTSSSLTFSRSATP
eukprot:15467677-Alexandrium_andersonii.AAC.1